MASDNQVVKFLKVIVICILQMIMTQVVTFVVALFFPGGEDFLLANPVIFAAVLGLTFSAGVFLAGWLAIKLGWLKIEPRLAARAVGALVGAFLPLVAALLIYSTLEAGSPFFLGSVLASLVGFYMPGLFASK
jgi:hypothetical protein